MHLSVLYSRIVMNNFISSDKGVICQCREFCIGCSLCLCVFYILINTREKIIKINFSTFLHNLVKCYIEIIGSVKNIFILDQIVNIFFCYKSMSFFKNLYGFISGCSGSLWTEILFIHDIYKSGWSKLLNGFRRS